MATDEELRELSPASKALVERYFINAAREEGKARIAELEGERGAALALASATKERCDHAEALWQAAEAALAEARTQIEQLKTALPDCHVCGGSGKIHEDAVTTGRNQHSACVGPCDHCDGLGVEL